MSRVVYGCSPINPKYKLIYCRVKSGYDLAQFMLDFVIHRETKMARKSDKSALVEHFTKLEMRMGDLRRWKKMYRSMMQQIKKQYQIALAHHLPGTSTRH
jgi:hypothetical protein